MACTVIMALQAYSVRSIQTSLSIKPSDVLEEVKKLEVSRTDADIVYALLDEAGAAFVVVDKHGIINVFSPGAEEFFGHSRKDVMGYGIGFLIPDGMRDKHMGAFQTAMGGENNRNHHIVPCQAERKDGTPIDVVINIFYRPGGRALAIFMDADKSREYFGERNG